MTTLFISHSSKDKPWAERLAATLGNSGYSVFLDSRPDDYGIPAGANWERTLYRRLRQSRGVVALCTADWLASPWCVAEAILAREQEKPVFVLAAAGVIDGRQVKGAQDAPLQIPDFLKDRQWISLSGVTEEAAHQSLVQGLEKEGVKKHFILPRRPYPGLEPFQETDAAVFFGRDAEINQVIDALHKGRKGTGNAFILILGASGCGKSSLMRAGVLPHLKDTSQNSDTRATWVVVPPFLSGRGLEGLALQLAQAFKDAGEKRELGAVRKRFFAGDLRTLGSDLLLANNASSGCLLLVLDQLEEVFGTPEKAEARAALRLLLDTSADASGSLVVLATMRSDFLNAFQLFEGAAGRYETVTVDPMLYPHFSDVIEKPADAFGLELDAGLSKRMVDDTVYNNALPLLAFTLERLYEKCQAIGRLTTAAYVELGGVSEAIKRTADAILKESGYSVLPADDPRMRDLRRAFHSLVQVGKEGQFTMRIAAQSLMPASCTAILKRFVTERLLVSDTANDEPILSVAHERLFEVWDTLSRWLNEDRKALALRSQIEEAAGGWNAAGRVESRLWPDARVLDALGEIGRSGVTVDNEVARAFLGPTEPDKLERLPFLGAEHDAEQGCGPYGAAWALPLSHDARASVGVRLAKLGDRRSGVGLRADGLPDICWCPVDGGAVIVQIAKFPNNPKSDVAVRRSGIVESFQIARYPVTVAQYHAFIEAKDGWQNDDWWLDLHRKDRAAVDDVGRFGNHPAANVNWWDACAFCHWLGHRLRSPVRLPTELEWQRAATEGDPEAGTRFPWGGTEFDHLRANTNQSGLGRSTAVGLYPLGVSRWGVMDLAGTIWEWCSNAFDDWNDGNLDASEKPNASKKEDARTLRGGAWNYDPEYCRAAYRGSHAPEVRSRGVGFRVLLSPSIEQLIAQ